MRTLESITFSKPRSQMEMGPIKDALGDDMPQITPDALGKYRLMMALKNKYGANYRNVPMAASAMKHFENEHALFKGIRKIQSQTGK